MKRILLITFMFVSALATESWAQTRSVTGKVTSAEDGSTLPGVNVILKGTTTGTVTDIDGNYRISVPEDGGTLVFSFIGLATQEAVVGARSVVDVQMESDVQQLSELVVTGMAIERERRELGYAVATVGGDELTRARDANVLNSLAGKVAGVVVNQQSGTLGGSSNIIIRGASSLGPDNQPLFVVDGVPISNSSYNGSRNEIIGGGVDVGNRAGDLNPDDIASMNVMKGSAATALYGARAKNGAIIITTKRGSSKQKTFATINSSIRFDNVLKLPDFQNEYASGNYGQYDIRNFNNGWGPKISEVQDQEFINFLGEQERLKAYPNNVKDFYETGVTLINSISFSDGSDEGDFRIGFTNLKQTGTVPESELSRNTLALNVGRKLGSGFSVRSSVNYVRTDSEGRPAQGSNNPNIIASLINGIPRTYNTEDLRNNVVDENGQAIGLNLNNTVNNPYWVTKNNKFTNEVERIFGNVELSYDPLDWLNIVGRVGTDIFTENRRTVVRKGTLNALNGSFDTRELFNREFNTDLMLTISKNINEDLTFQGILGHNVNQRSFRRSRVQANNLNVDMLYNYANAQVATPTNQISLRRLYGVYADIGFDYKGFLSLNITGRNDWSSTLPKSNNSYFYPGISTSFIFTDAFNIENRILTFGKFRANYANVGSDTDPYELDFQYFPLADVFTQYVDNNIYPHGGQTAFGATSVIPAGQSLKPQNQEEWEIGTELMLFGGRIMVDATYYNKVTDNQILNIDIAQSTGFVAKTVNAGKISNKGIEIFLSGTPLKLSNGLDWTIDFNFAKNKQTVEELAEGLDEFALVSGFSGLSQRAQKGETFGLYGAGWKRDPNGNVIINPNTGLREVGDRIRLGDIYPEWTLGINNTVSFKGLSLSFLIDIREGGVMYSATAQGLRSSGLAKETLENRGQVFIDKGVIDNGDGTFRENDVPVQSMQDFWGTYSSNSVTESNTFDASYVKLREVRLAYSLPKSLVDNTFFGSIEVGLEGRNLWIIDDNVPHVDPEANFFGASLVGQNVEFNSVPSTRSYGFNLRLTF